MTLGAFAGLWDHNHYCVCLFCGSKSGLWPASPAQTLLDPDWAWPDACYGTSANAWVIDPIVGLLHHGSQAYWILICLMWSYPACLAAFG